MMVQENNVVRCVNCTIDSGTARGAGSSAYGIRANTGAVVRLDGGTVLARPGVAGLAVGAGQYYYGTIAPAGGNGNTGGANGNGGGWGYPGYGSDNSYNGPGAGAGGSGGWGGSGATGGGDGGIGGPGPAGQGLATGGGTDYPSYVVRSNQTGPLFGALSASTRFGNAGDGPVGFAGAGGGGGGGGGAPSGSGNIGGNGGAGGKGGRGMSGLRGSAGGGSFGIYLYNARLEVKNWTKVNTSVGGNGGNGGNGVTVGETGTLGSGFTMGIGSGKPGGAGGKGGTGGGGPGGGGGQGGPSFGVVSIQPPQPTTKGINVDSGSPDVDPNLWAQNFLVDPTDGDPYDGLGNVISSTGGTGGTNPLAGNTPSNPGNPGDVGKTLIRCLPDAATQC
ncbi:MAG: hypothetical protein R2698_06500 [Microthrixaceae bacterium]